MTDNTSIISKVKIVKNIVFPKELKVTGDSERGILNQILDSEKIFKLSLPCVYNHVYSIKYFV